MPTGKRSSRKRKRVTRKSFSRTRRRLTFGRRRKSTTALFNGLAGKRRVVKMRYCERFSLDATAGAVAHKTFRLGSVYDPNFTDAGHQPYLHDQWKAVYGRYLVIGAKMRVQFLSTGTATTGQAICGIYADNDSTLNEASTPDTLLESGKSRWKVIANMDGSHSTSNMILKYKPKRMFLMNNITDKSDEFGADFGATPSRGGYAHVWTTSTTDAANPDAVNCVCVIDYIVILSEPLDVLGS